MSGRWVVCMLALVGCSETGVTPPDRQTVESVVVERNDSSVAIDESASADSEPLSILPMEKIGDRRMVVAQTTYRFPWYYLRADHNQLRSGAAWQRIKPPEGTKAAFIGRYGEIEWTEYSDEAIETVGCTGLDFRGGGTNSSVGPGEGPVYILPWCYEETVTTGGMRFRGDRDFVICLSRIPRATFTNLEKKPGCELPDELEHLIGVIEVEHTYDWKTLPDWETLSVSKETLVSLTRMRHWNDEGYVLEYAIRRDTSASYQVATPDGSAPATESIIDKCLYALRSSRWRELPGAHQFGTYNPPITKTIVVVDGLDGTIELTVEYDNGGWYATHLGKHYALTHPQLLFRVQREIDIAVADL